MSTPAESASPSLAELDAIARRARWTASRSVSAVPLVAWGGAWAIGYPALALLPFPAAAILGGVLALAAALVATLVRPFDVRRGFERMLGLAWIALLLGSAGLLATAEPLPVSRAVLVLGAVWGLALLVLGLALRDLPLAILGGGLVALAVLARIASVGSPAVAVGAFGVAGGIAMAALGVIRMRRPR